MKQLIFKTFVLFFSSLFTYCIAQDNSVDTDSLFLQVDVPKGKAIIYILRPSALGFGVKFNVECDGNYIGATYGVTYIYTIQDPGWHNITSMSENKAEVGIYLEKDGVYFIKQVVSLGFMVARTDLKKINESEGKVMLSRCKLPKDFREQKKNFEVDNYNNLDSILYHNNSFNTINDYLDLMSELQQNSSFKELKLIESKYSNGNYKMLGLKAKHFMSPNTDYYYKIGTWTYYHKNGSISKLVEYDLRERMSGRHITYDKEGNIISKTYYYSRE